MIELPHRVRTKSPGQKPDCLYKNCPNNKSDLEVRCVDSAIRCCTERACQAYAKSVAFGLEKNPES